ncbi:MAG: glucose-1-phosphate adenylyltransferase [Planctomycetes bacterium]|nr:glucose-1-phosphate adenylyltransferase [Planctomycetota bacterium]
MSSLPQELKRTLTFVLAGGQGERLKPLTAGRAKPAVPFGGAYRIIDFTLSNCIHSGLRKIFVLTQYRARSLEEHLRFGWNFLPRRLQQFIVQRPPQHGESDAWYRGTADAIYQNLDGIEEEDPGHIVVLSADHIYKMDYGRMLREHLKNQAALTIGAVRISSEEAKRFGVLEVEKSNRVRSLAEKPQSEVPEIPGQPGECLGSMGIYIFSRDELVRRLVEDAALGDESSHDFGKDIIPKMIDESRVFAHHLANPSGKEKPYWRDVGTIDSYYETNLDLCSIEPSFNLYDRDWPIYTLWHNDPPAKTVFDDDERRVRVVDSLICPGAVVSGASVKNSILANRVFVDERADIDGAILFGGVVVGKGAVIRRAIVDKWNSVPPGEQIGVDLEADAKRFKVSDSGIVVVPRDYRWE